MRYMGRERRRKGSRNLLRRGLYAVLLWLSPHTPSAAAAPSEAPASPKALSATLTIEAQPANSTGVASSYRIAFVPPDSRIAAPLRRAADLLRTRTWEFNDNLLSLRGGVKLALDLPDGGNLHLDLFPDEDNPDRGRRWKLTTPAEDGRTGLWSIGGSVIVIDELRERGPYRAGTDRQFTVAPQLVLDMDELAGMPGNARLTLQRCNWHDGVTDRFTEDRVWQLNVRWRF